LKILWKLKQSDVKILWLDEKKFFFKDEMKEEEDLQFEIQMK
jgi:hypothetical protein